jgi:bile salt-stimulated lipase
MLQKYFLLSLFVLGVRCDKETPVVKTPLGRVRGYVKMSTSGKTFSAFEGIPYAKPPVGDRRFQEPEPVEAWSGTWNAFYTSQCVQTGMIKLTTLDGQEDCLYVNVYVPRPNPNPQEKLDVIVHIHGGSFVFGNSHSYAHPEFMMDHDVIFVSLNYRLGMFGFLSTEDDVVSGNNGLKDQVLALKWVQSNIASFGGNPKSVTLTGLSAGGSSVHLHYLSHMSKGLFHRGFSQSGVALNPWVLQEQPLAKAKLLGDAVGCPTTSSEVLVQCLRKRNYKHLITKMPIFYGYLFTPYAPFSPVIEKGSNSFLNESPYELIAKGQIEDLPWIVSNTAHEGMLPGAYLYKDLKTIDEKWTELAPFLLDYNYSLPISQWKDTAETIRKYYFGEEKISSDNFLKLVKLFSDRLFLVDSEISAKLVARTNKSPVYYYYFSYPGDHSQNNTVSHADDAQYIFSNMFQRKTMTKNEQKMKDVMLNMLISFAKTGEPVVDGVTWEPTKDDKLVYLHFENIEPKSIKMESTEELAPRDFWKALGFLENENLVPVKDEL